MERNDATSTDETVMEQSDSTSGVAPYELATLAGRIDPERCVSEPKEAIAAAERLLQEAKAASERAHEEERTKHLELEIAQMPRINWVHALKEITGQARRDRAVECFLELMEHHDPGKSKQHLNDYKRDGFISAEIFAFQLLFERMKEQKPKKGKQGRRISEHDGRLRTELVGLVPRKPRKRV